MKAFLRFLLFIILLLITIFGSRFIIKKLGPQNWETRIKNKRISAEKRINALKKNIESIIELHRKHIATMDSLIKAYKEIAKASTDQIKNLQALSETQNRVGNEYLKIGYLQQALKYYNLALELNPFDIETLVNKGIVFYNIGLYENDPEKQYKEFLNAETSYKKAINIAKLKASPTDKQHQIKANIYLSLLYRIIKEKKIDIANVTLGVESAKRDFLQLALDSAENALVLDPENIETLFMLGALNYMSGKLSRAKRYYMQIIASNRATRSQSQKAQTFVNRIDGELRNPGNSR